MRDPSEESRTAPKVGGGVAAGGLSQIVLPALLSPA